MFFRIEDNNGFNPKLREYNKDSFESPFIKSSDADKYIAEEIRKEVNGANERSLFSCTRSLGVALFKYDYYADNFIIIEYDLEDEVRLEVKDTRIERSCYYDILDLNYPLKHLYPNKKIKIFNFSIAVDNDKYLNRYLKAYTGIGKKKFAAVEKDSEVIIKHMNDDIKVSQHIDALYILYALQWRTNFLKCYYSREYLKNVYDKLEIDKSEREAFYKITSYLYCELENEKKMSQRILREKLNDSRGFVGCDSYEIAYNLLTPKNFKANNWDICWEFPIEEVWKLSTEYLFDELVDEIWEAYKISI